MKFRVSTKCEQCQNNIALGEMWTKVIVEDTGGCDWVVVVHKRGCLREFTGPKQTSENDDVSDFPKNDNPHPDMDFKRMG